MEDDSRNGWWRISASEIHKGRNPNQTSVGTFQRIWIQWADVRYCFKSSEKRFHILPCLVGSRRNQTQQKPKKIGCNRFWSRWEKHANTEEFLYLFRIFFLSGCFWLASKTITKIMGDVSRFNAPRNIQFISHTAAYAASQTKLRFKAFWLFAAKYIFGG